jgi:hypothetical protein
LRAQGTLLTGIRGCDLATKPHEPTPERQLVSFFRYCVMVPHDPREIDVPNAFFRSMPPEKWKPSQLMHFPLHWYTHLMHCFEVVGYCHPGNRPNYVHGVEIPAYERLSVRTLAFCIYQRMAEALHLNIETKEQMLTRMNEDRIASRQIVS